MKWKFVTLRPRMDPGEILLEGVREWTRLNPTVALEVSEFLEVLAVVRQSDLIGLAPRSLAEAARVIPEIQVVRGVPAGTSFPVRMIWRVSRGSDKAQEFLQDQIRAAVKEVVKAVAVNLPA